ncbi:uncharacterized protein LOC134531935 [Bacillus rossius redtenbacheri]|uniref:uncharacterized protein LOC134531935 n=1 Tax=Bacillus rossius redtenbacheri TaxID=93214 RepID=UPI002FDE3D40
MSHFYEPLVGAQEPVWSEVAQPQEICLGHTLCSRPQAEDRPVECGWRMLMTTSELLCRNHALFYFRGGSHVATSPRGVKDTPAPAAPAALRSASQLVQVEARGAVITWAWFEPWVSGRDGNSVGSRVDIPPSLLQALTLWRGQLRQDDPRRSRRQRRCLDPEPLPAALAPMQGVALSHRQGRMANRLAELPPVGVVAAPVRVTVHYRPQQAAPRRPAARYTRSISDQLDRAAGLRYVGAQDGARRVRFELPPAGGSTGAARAAPQVAGVDSWLRSRCGAADGSRATATATAGGAARPHHDTSRYRKGTLPPTEHAAAAGPLEAAQAVIRAARDGDEEALTALLRRPAGQPQADLNCVDSSGRTAVSHAASFGSVAMLEALLRVPGVDVNKPDKEGNTPLHFAAQAGHAEAINFLLSRCPGIEVDARNNLGFTPLMKAALQGRTKVAKLLLYAGASPTLRDTGRGLRAEQWARFCGRYVCAEVIEKHARHKLLDRSTSYGRWGSEPEMAARLLMGAHDPAPTRPGFRSKLKKAFRPGAAAAETPPRRGYSLVGQLTTAVLCAGSAALPPPSVPPAIKSVMRPLSVPRLQVTLAGGEAVEAVEEKQLAPALDAKRRSKKKK